jgi:orotidine-5'-phosphate decarboxylase
LRKLQADRRTKSKRKEGVGQLWRKTMRKKTGLILALDVLSRETALDLALSIGGSFDAIKVGYPLILAAGLGVVSEISDIVPVIADLKVADIPNTNELICRQALQAGASGLIAHAFPGRDSLEACLQAAQSSSAELFVVTEMSHPGAGQFMAPLAEEMARLAMEVDASGVVAPATRPERIRIIRSIVGDKIIMSPGVGVQGGSPTKALQAGADFLIVGRSVVDARNPASEVERLIATLEGH